MSTPETIPDSPIQGVQIRPPAFESGCTDFFTATHPDRKFLQSFFTGNKEKDQGSTGGYYCSYRDRDGVVVSWGHPFTSSARISLSGRTLERLRQQGRLVETFFRLEEYEAKPTRIDLARDSNGRLTPQYLARADLQGRVWTRYDKLNPYGHLKDPDCSIDAGKRGGNSYFHAYRKDLQLLSDGQDCPISPLTRWELQFGPEAAPGIFSELVEMLRAQEPSSCGDREPAFLLANREIAKRFTIFSSKEEKEKGHKGRHASEWARFIERKAPKVTAGLEVAADIDSAQGWANWIEWFLKAASPALFQAYQVGGSDVLVACAMAGEGRGDVIKRSFAVKLAGPLSGEE